MQRIEGLEWGVAAAPMRGEPASADLHVVEPVPSGVVLAVVDGIGHGGEARAASSLAAEVTKREAARGAVAIIRLCHTALIGTRGVVMSVASIDFRDHTVTWLGVGNVAGLLVRGDQRATPPRESMFVRSGVVGMQLPLLQASVVSIAAGDTLVMTTDGIRPEFGESIFGRISPPRMAERLLAEHGRGTDDALALVIRYLGRAADGARTAERS